MDLTDLAVRLIACARCSAVPGARCTTTSGRRATYTHGARTLAVYAAWRDGYGDALRDTLDTAERSAQAGHTLTDLIRDLRLRLELRAR